MRKWWDKNGDVARVLYQKCYASGEKKFCWKYFKNMYHVLDWDMSNKIKDQKMKCYMSGFFISLKDCTCTFVWPNGNGCQLPITCPLTAVNLNLASDYFIQESFPGGEQVSGSIQLSACTCNKFKGFPLPVMLWAVQCGLNLKDNWQILKYITKRAVAFASLNTRSCESSWYCYSYRDLIILW
jgi:hypothetical protein